MKQMHGQFFVKLPSGDELVLKNQFTTIGMQQVLMAAFQQIPTVWYIGLCAHNPADGIALSEMQEPTVGFHGYARVPLTFGPVNWPELGVINGESFINSRPVIFVLTGAIDRTVNRLFLTDGSNVIAVSSEIVGGLQVLAAPYTTSYRLFFH